MSDKVTSKQLEPIDDVIRRLGEVIAWSQTNASPAGYFAALYRLVTMNIRAKMKGGQTFDDDSRMVTFDARFAGRYLDAFGRWRDQGTPTHAWTVAFDAVSDPGVSIMQHLMLGINAHMNLDLPVVAASLAVDGDLSSLRGDFDRINDILGGLVTDVETTVGELSPRLGKIESFAPELEADAFGLGLVLGRDVAWHDAEHIVGAGASSHERAVASLDTRVAVVGKGLHHLPRVLDRVNRWIQEVESTDVAANVEALAALR